MKAKAKPAKSAGPSGMIHPPSKRLRLTCGGEGCKVILWTEAALKTHRAMCPAWSRSRYPPKG